MGVKDAWNALFRKTKEENTKPPKGGEIGYSGNKIFSGYPLDEYNPELNFPESVRIYDRMRRSDGQIAAIMAAMKLPIRSTKWYMEPPGFAKSQRQAQEIAKFAEDNLLNGGMKYSWDDHLREALLMLDFGFSVFEKVWRFDTWRGRRVVMLDKYAPRVASSIWRFPQDKNYNVQEVEQINYNTGEVINMPLDKVRLYTYQREGDNPVGISALRPAYKHWYYKEALYKIMAVGVEKSLIGTPYAQLPEGTSDDDREDVLDLLSAVRVSEDAGFTIPKEVVVDILEGKKNPVDATPFVEHQDTMIARSVLAQFINLGTMSSASGGAYALGREMVDMFCMSLEAIANAIQAEIQKDVEMLTKWNFGADAPVPKLKHKDISFRDMTQVATALSSLGNGHLINPDEELENYIREVFGIPPIPKSALRNQRTYPPNRYEPDIVSDSKLSKKDIENIKNLEKLAKGNVPTIKPGGGQQGGGQMTDEETGEQFSWDQVIPGRTGGEKPEPEGTTKWRRDLNVQEKVVDLEDLNNNWDTAEEQMTADMRKTIKKSANKYIAQIQKILNGDQSKPQKIKAVKNLTAKYEPEYIDAIRKHIDHMYQYGVKSVNKELQTQTQPSASGTASLKAKAEALAALQIQKMVSSVQMSVLSNIGRGVPVKRIVHDAHSRADDYINGPDLKSAATISVGEAVNVGRGDAAKEAGVVGARWSAILDNKTCELCRELDEQVIKVDNPDYDIFQPPIHQNCRCFWIYIMKDSTDINYDWSRPAGKKVKKFGTLIT